MSLNGLDTNTYKGKEKQDIPAYDLAVQGQPPSPQPQSGPRDYEVPSPLKQFPPPAVAPSQDKEGGTQGEAVYEPMPG